MGTGPAQAGTGIQSIEAITYLYTDHLMTNRLATGQSKTIIWRWEGEAFGNIPAQELGTISVNLRFPGQYYDSETNLHYNMMRYYDPALGRYITSDPIGISGGMNTYLYARANPTRFTDPLGLATFFGGELHFGAGGGLTQVSCCDENNTKWTMKFWKVCGGLTVGIAGVVGKVFGLDGKDCRPERYEGYFWEFASPLPIPYSGVSGDVGVNRTDSAISLPSGPSGVSEVGGSVGVPGLGLSVGISLCYYSFLEPPTEEGSCKCDD